MTFDYEPGRMTWQDETGQEHAITYRIRREGARWFVVINDQGDRELRSFDDPVAAERWAWSRAMDLLDQRRAARRRENREGALGIAVVLALVVALIIWMLVKA